MARAALREVWPPLAILGAILLSVGPPLWDGRLFVGIDNITYYMPFYEVLGDRLRQGDLPGWNPHIFAGTAFAGDPQSGWMYLPAMLFFTVLPAGLAMKAFMLFHLFGAGTSAYALGRVLGMPRLAASVAGIAFVFSPLVGFVECCAIRIQVAAWVPLAFLGIELAIRAPDWPTRLAWSGLTGFTLSQIAAGWPGQGAYYCGLAIGSYVAFRTLIQPASNHLSASPPLRLSACLAIGVAILVIGGGLGAAGLLPRLDSLGQTNLAGGDYAEDANQTGLDAEMGGWRWERLTGYLLDSAATSRWYYAGAATLALAILAPVLARLRFGVPFFAVYSIVVATLATPDIWLHRLFYLLPRFESLHEHAPNRVLALLPIGLAMLAGASVAGLQRRQSPPWLIAVLAGVPLLVLESVRPWVREERNPLSGESWAAVGIVSATLIAFAGVIAFGRKRPLPGAVPQLVLVVPLVALVLDPVGFVRLGMLPERDLSAARAREIVEVYSGAEGTSGAAAFLRARLAEGEPFRYIGYHLRPLMRDHRDRYITYYTRPDLWAILEANLALPNGLYNAQGYNPVQYTRFIDYLLVMNAAPQEYHETNVQIAGLSSPLLDLLNVRYVVTPTRLPLDDVSLAPIASTWPIVYEDERSRIFENPDVLPRAWIVHEARELPSEQGLNLLEFDQADPRETAFLEETPPPLAQPANPDADRATVTHYEGDMMRVATTTDAAGLLMLSETYDPGWRAYVDGKRVDLYAADGLFRAVPIPAGSHTVELRYEPGSLKVGLTITVVTATAVAALVAFVVIERGQARRRPSKHGRTAAV